VGAQLTKDRTDIDEQVWIPISTLMRHWPRDWTTESVVTKIVYRLAEPGLIGESELEVRAILAERLGVPANDTEAIGIWSSLKFLAAMPVAEMNSTLFVLAVGTLVIGGIGVLSMMLDAVHERRSEIGVRLAVGARRRDIVMQFFIETFTICMLGGMLGAGLGVAACYALGLIPAPDLVPVPVLRPGIVWLSLGSLVTVGLVAGVVPAWRAAHIDPALTLRME
jgi:ABC-type antimicrobial peptide transport system permease subunit